MRLFILLLVFVVTITIIGCGTTEQREIPVDYPIKPDITDNAKNKNDIEQKQMKELKFSEEKEKAVEDTQKKEVAKVDKVQKKDDTNKKKAEKQIDEVKSKDVKLPVKNDYKNKTIHVPGKTTNEDIDIDFDVEGKKYYYLRIISLPKFKYYKKNAMKVKKFMDEKYPDKTIKVRSAQDKEKNEYWVIDIGKFKKIDKKAKEFRKEVQNIRYQKRRDFSSSFFLKY